MGGGWINGSSQSPCSLGREHFSIRKSHLHSTIGFKNTTYPIRSQDIFCFFIFMVGLNFKWIPITTVLLKQGHCFWRSWGWLLTRWNWWGTRLFHEFKFLDIKKKWVRYLLATTIKFKYIIYSINVHAELEKKKLNLILQVIHFLIFKVVWKHKLENICSKFSLKTTQLLISL